MQIKASTGLPGEARVGAAAGLWLGARDGGVMGRNLAVVLGLTGLLAAGAAWAQAGGQSAPGTAVPKPAHTAPAAKAPSSCSA